jgi:hypothetical protein
MHCAPLWGGGLSCGAGVVGGRCGGGCAARGGVGSEGRAGQVRQPALAILLRGAVLFTIDLKNLAGVVVRRVNTQKQQHLDNLRRKDPPTRSRNN